MIDEGAIAELKKILFEDNPELSQEDIDNMAAILLELATFLVRLKLDHKNQEKQE